MAGYNTKKDKILCGVSSYSFVSRCQQSDNLKLESRLEKLDKMLKEPYWEEYFNKYNDAKGNKNDYLAEQSVVELNIEKLGNYALFHKDSARITKNTNYIILKNKKAFQEYLDKEDLSNHSSETIVTYLENKQYYLEKTTKFKKSMLNKPITEHYKKFYNQLCDFDGSYVGVRTRLIEEKNKLVEENKILREQLWDVEDRSKMDNILQATLHSKIIFNRNKINENIKKIKTILYWYSKYKRNIEEDVLLLNMALEPKIYFKHVKSFIYNKDILNFFDYFDIIDDFANIEMLEMIVKVGRTEESENVLYELIFDNSVYENMEAMDILRKLVNYYLDDIVTDEHERLIFEMWRNGLSQVKIREITANNKEMSTRNVGYIIAKILRNISKKHLLNVDYVYETTAVRSHLVYCKDCGMLYPKSHFNKTQTVCKKCVSENAKTAKTCKICGVTKKASSFSKDKRNSDGLHTWCKDCKKEYMIEKRKEE